MSSKSRRFEVLLPLRFNDGRDVDPALIAEAVLEIVDHFGAASYETQKVEGHWRQRLSRQSGQDRRRCAELVEESEVDEILQSPMEGKAPSTRIVVGELPDRN
jgi:hypothetical protein